MGLHIDVFDVDVAIRRRRRAAPAATNAGVTMPQSAGPNGARAINGHPPNGSVVGARSSTTDRVFGRAAGPVQSPSSAPPAVVAPPLKFVAPPMSVPVAPPPAQGRVGAAPPEAGAPFKPMFKRLAAPAPRAEPPSDIQLGARLDAVGNGRPLDAATRRQMGNVFGTDVGDVRVHADEQAASLASDLGAEAFTVGRDIYFGAGKFDPASTQGRALLAHELTHVLQQKGTPTPRAQGFAGSVGEQGLEGEAEAVRKVVLTTLDGFHSNQLNVEKYTCTYVPNRVATAEEQARLERIAARALIVCHEILSAQPDVGSLAPAPIAKVELDVRLTLAGVSDEDAARVWGRQMAARILAAAKAAGASAPAGVESQASLTPVAGQTSGAGFVQRADDQGGMTGSQGTSSQGSGPNASTPTPEQVKGRERLDAALKAIQDKTFTQGMFKDIEEADWALAKPEEKIRLIEAATDPSWFWVGPLDEYAIEGAWRSFGETLESAVEAHPIVWERSINRGADPESIPETRGKLDIFKGLTIDVARQNLDLNEDAIIAEMKGWGLTPPKQLLRDPSKGGDGKSPAGPLSPDVIKRLEEQRKLARLVIRHERSLAELRKRRVGKMAEEFDPGRPPGEDWEFAGKTTYAWVKETWDRVTGEISLILNAYPALYAAHGRDELDKLAFAQPLMHKGGEFYFAGMETLVETQQQLERSLEGIKKTREKLGDSDAYLDLVPVHRSIYAGRALSPAGHRFTRAVMQPIVFDEKEMKDDIAAAQRFGIDAALFLLVLAGTIGTMGGAAIAIGIAGARALQAQSRADELAAAHGAAVGDDAALVTKSAVTAAQAEAEAAQIDVLMTALMEAQGAAMHLASSAPGVKPADPKGIGQRLQQASASGEGEMGDLRSKLRARQAEGAVPARGMGGKGPAGAAGPPKDWTEVPRPDRPKQLEPLVNKTLDSKKVPNVEVAESKKPTSWWDHENWTIQMESRFFGDSISQATYEEMTARMWHEADHADLWYNMARAKAPEFKNAGELADAFHFKSPRARAVAEEAFRNPIPANDPARPKLLDNFETIYGARRNQPGGRNAVYRELDAAEQQVAARKADWEEKARALGKSSGPQKAQALEDLTIADEAWNKAWSRYEEANKAYQNLPEEVRAFETERWRTNWQREAVRAKRVGDAQERAEFWRGRLDAARAERARYESMNASREALDEADVAIAIAQDKWDAARQALAKALLM